jgi:hypothetical protein
MTTTINASTSSGLVTTPDNSGAIALQNNGVTGLNLTAAGYPLTPLRPAFYGFRNGGNVSATNTVLHNAVITNIGSFYNASTGVFTCPVAGVYEAMVGGHAENSQPVVMQIKQNGIVKAEEYGNGAAYMAVSTFAIMSCAAGDTITHVVSVGTFWGGSDSGLRMSVKLIG